MESGKHTFNNRIKEKGKEEMAKLYLNEKAAVEIQTWEEAACLRGLLINHEYQSIRIGQVYLYSTYKNSWEAREMSKGGYRAEYENMGELPQIIAPVMPVSADQITIQVMASDGRGIVIDVEKVKAQLCSISLSQEKYGDFAALSWNHTLRTVLASEGIIEIEFAFQLEKKEWYDRISIEKVICAGMTTTELIQKKYRDELDKEYHVCRYSAFFPQAEGYMEIAVMGEELLDTGVKGINKKKSEEEMDNWLDPEIEAAMLQNGYWDYS